MKLTYTEAREFLDALASAAGPDDHIVVDGETFVSLQYASNALVTWEMRRDLSFRPCYRSGKRVVPIQVVPTHAPRLSMVADQRGATAVEYGLIVGGISVAIIGVASAVGANLASVYGMAIAALATVGM
jgi:Flp pilus assembly pilin Flp